MGSSSPGHHRDENDELTLRASTESTLLLCHANDAGKFDMGHVEGVIPEIDRYSVRSIIVTWYE